jgi:hypothetical protein
MNHHQPSCLSCGNQDLKSIISFGYTPLADNLLTREQDLVGWVER